MGVYEFTIRSGSTVVVGTLQALDGSIRVTPREGSCYVDRAAQPQENREIFKCEGVVGIDQLTLSIDRSDPQGRSRWSGEVNRMVKEQECTAYTVDSRGQRVCSEWRTRNVERAESLGGTILLRGLGRDN